MRVVVWDDKSYGDKASHVYPEGLGEYIAGFLRSGDIEVITASLQDEECGLTDEVLKDTDVLIWWAHTRHAMVPDEIVDRVHNYILGGMGFIALHSAHFSKIFKRLMGTACSLKWRENARERLWTIMPNHPIAEGVDETFVLECEEMYGEVFDIAKPEELIFMGWYKSGEVFRSGCTWTRGHGRIFYFQPGHETNTAFKNKNIQKIIKNAVKWACPIKKNIEITCPEFEALE